MQRAMMNVRLFALGCSSGAVVLLILLAVGGPLGARVCAQEPMVTTDWPDYSPGETANITGAGFHANEPVGLTVTHLSGGDGGPGHEPWIVQANENGEFEATWYVDPGDSQGSTFLLTADCLHGLHAEMSFSDHKVRPGACCTIGTFCLVTFEMYCREGHGVFMGEGTTCDPNPCCTLPIVSITGPASGALYPVGTEVTFSGTFSTNCAPSSAEWEFTSHLAPIVVPGFVDVHSNTVTASYSFATPGVYFVKLTVTNTAGSGSADTVSGGPEVLPAFIVVYDPAGGFVTGGGWITSPPGAYVPDPSLTGKASFGFVARYRHGANAPDGNTEFQFRAADLNFHSTAYEWLVVAGARAQFKGTGTINNQGDYHFMLTAIDGQVNGGGGTDRFRMKIWADGAGLIYDNQMGAGDNDDPTTVLGGGSVVIHKP